MIVSSALAEVYQKATGKATTITATDTKGVKILPLLNYYSIVWGRDDWQSMRSNFTVGTVTATNTFSVASLTTLDHPSSSEGDFVRITSSNGLNEYDYDLVPIDRLYEDGQILNSSGRRCAISGTSLIFESTFTSSDPQFGGTIKLPGYLKPNTLSSDSDTIQVNLPEWLTTRCAAQYVLTDRTRVQLYDTLLAEAKSYWDTMKMAEDTQIETVHIPWNPVPNSGPWC